MLSLRAEDILQLRQHLAPFGPEFLFRGQTNAYAASDGLPNLNSSFIRKGCLPPLMLKWIFYTNELLRRGGIHAEQLKTGHLTQGLLQHYGWRSFFVDLTASPAVAAWFASHSFSSKRSWQFCENSFEEPVMLGEQTAHYTDHGGAGHLYVLNKEQLKESGHELVSLVDDLTTDCVTRFQVQQAWLAGLFLKQERIDPLAITAEITASASVFKELSEAAGDVYKRQLQARGIPSKSYYQESELDSEVAQERLAIFKLFVNRADRIALRWLLGMGSNDFRAKSYARLRAHCERTGQSPWDALVALSTKVIDIPYCSQLVQRFHAIQNELRFLDEQIGVEDFVNRWLRAEFAGAGELRILVGSLMAEAETPEELLSSIVQAVSQPEIPPDVTEVRIMSLHKSKGLSSPVVVIAGCVDGLLPSEPEPGTPIAERQTILEEQRRLFFVGITRVKAIPSSNRPGSLLLTGSQTMTLADAMQSGIQPAGVSYGVVTLHLSRFIPELGPNAPAPIAR